MYTILTHDIKDVLSIMNGDELVIIFDDVWDIHNNLVHFTGSSSVTWKQKNRCSAPTSLFFVFFYCTIYCV